MSTVKKLQSSLDALNAQRRQIADAGWFLQHCWLVQVKPGGTARTSSKYWQVRSRQPIFNGKTLKHLKPDEVEDYRAAIERGRQLKQLDRQIAKLQQQVAQLTPAIDLASSESPAHESSLPSTDQLQQFVEKQPQNRVKPSELAEQERLVQELLADSHALRSSLRRSIALSKQTGAQNIALRKKYSRPS